MHHRGLHFVCGRQKNVVELLQRKHMCHDCENLCFDAGLENGHGCGFDLCGLSCLIDTFPPHLCWTLDTLMMSMIIPLASLVVIIQEWSRKRVRWKSSGSCKNRKTVKPSVVCCCLATNNVIIQCFAPQPNEF